MKFPQVLLPSVFLFLLLILVCIEHGHHNTTKQKKFHSVSRKKKLPPPPSPSYVTDPTNNESSTNTGVVFNVMKFGAAGNGATDDTEAFKKAWNAACQSKKTALLLVPDGHSFMIKTTTFAGPCKNSILFQVMFGISLRI